MNADQKNIDSPERITEVPCWCGMTVTSTRLHYPGNDPENGPAHLPQEGNQCSNCGEIFPWAEINKHEMSHFPRGVEHDPSHKVHMPEGWCQEPTCNTYVDPESSTEPGRCGDCGQWLQQDEHEEALVFDQEGLIRCENYENCGVEYRPELGFGNHCSMACVDEMIHSASANEWNEHVDAHHELALLLNLMVDISCYSNDLPGELAHALDHMLADHTMLCITEHLNDYGDCIKAGCPVYERGGK